MHEVVNIAEVVRHPSGLPVPPGLEEVKGLVHLRIRGLCSGVYFLCLDGIVVYVGQSNSITTRIADHVKQTKTCSKFKTFDHELIYFIRCPESELDETEQFWIRRLKPKYNVTHKPREPKPSPGHGPLLVA